MLFDFDSDFSKIVSCIIIDLKISRLEKYVENINPEEHQRN